MEKCKYCEENLEARLYVKFFKTEVVTDANKKDSRLPKYGYHLGMECGACGKWQKFLPQADSITEVKFYAN